MWPMVLLSLLLCLLGLGITTTLFFELSLPSCISIVKVVLLICTLRFLPLRPTLLLTLLSSSESLACLTISVGLLLVRMIVMIESTSSSTTSEAIVIFHCGDRGRTGTSGSPSLVILSFQSIIRKHVVGGCDLLKMLLVACLLCWLGRVRVVFLR